MNFKIGNEVAYQVRHERKQSQFSFIKFMTDGILLK
jgi:HrpA-like RNA helicase